MREQIVDPLELIYLHVFVIPVELWLEQYRFAYNNAVLESKSAGFIRIAPKTSLFEIRKYIRDQLGEDNIPTDFVFLRSVGRCLAVVNQNQEMEMRAREFVPPATFSPELLLLPSSREDVLVTLPKTEVSNTSTQQFFQYNQNVPDRRENHSSESDDVPFSSLTNNDDSPSYETDNNKNVRSSSNSSSHSQTSAMPDVPIALSNEGFLVNRSSYKNQENGFQQIVTPTDDKEVTSREKQMIAALGAEQTSISQIISQEHKKADYLFEKKNEDLLHDDDDDDDNNDDNGVRLSKNSPDITTFSESSAKASRQSALTTKAEYVKNKPSGANKTVGEGFQPTYTEDEGIQSRETDFEIRHPSKEEVNRPESLKEIEGVEKAAINSSNKSEVPEISQKIQAQDFGSTVALANSTKTVDNDARRLALEAKMKARFEKEKKRLEEENLLNCELSEEKEKELISQVEEMRRMNNSNNDHRPKNTDQLTPRSLAHVSSTNKNTSVTTSEGVKENGASTKKRVSDETKLRELKNEEQERKKNDLIQQRRLEVEHLKEQLEEIKTEKHSIQRVRELNGKKMRSLQTELNMKNSHVNNQWKKKYEEERKQTVILEDKLKKFQGQVDFQHRKLISRSCLSKPKDVHSKGAPSERSNQQNMRLRLQNEIEQLKMTISLTNKKLTAEAKMKQFAVQELKELRTKAIESKINASRAKKTLSPPGT